MSNTVEVPSTGEAKDNEDVTVDDTAGGVVLLQANEYRKSALIINTGSASMRVTTDGEAPTATRGKLMVPGSTLTLSSPFCPTAEVKAIRAEATNTTANASEVD